MSSAMRTCYSFIWEWLFMNHEESYGEVLFQQKNIKRSKLFWRKKKNLFENTLNTWCFKHILNLAFTIQMNSNDKLLAIKKKLENDNICVKSPWNPSHLYGLMDKRCCHPDMLPSSYPSTLQSSFNSITSLMSRWIYFLLAVLFH